ncbi:hypothetical protein BGZ96_001073 [Linnemannia gamsii]|uniref:F-box domain-containing protein n=1 Tax=Linnemannia gamsii TaxID=64522 RepID=A0ABQ7KA81_9FUNG|nr:hypothetical protein BGZ96_001073 [Linnemannia gamsii]
MSSILGFFNAHRKSKTSSPQGTGAGSITTAATSTSPSQPQQRHQPKIHAALEIPEILHRAFDFVDEYTLHHTVILVCHQWFWMNQHRIVRKVNFFDSSKTKRLEKVVSRLPRATHMVWYTVSENWHSKLVQMLAENNSRQLQEQEQGLHGPLGQDAYFQPTTPTTHHGILKRRNPLQISRILRDLEIRTLGSFFLELLPSLGSLTSLRVRIPEYEKLCLDEVLSACPRLVFLSLKSEDNLVLQVSGTPFEEAAAEAAKSSPRLPLRTFIAENATITQPCLNYLLSVSPHLKNIQLRNLRHDRSILTPQVQQWSCLMAQLPAHSISLSSVHFSVRGQSMAEEEIYEKLMMVAPRSQEWVLRSIDFTPALTHCLRQLPNVVTHLELTAPFTSFRLGDGLHQYLCSSPHLLHLKALHAVTLIERMDIHGRWSSPANAVDYPPRIWACRNLRTLHIRCHSVNSEAIEERKGRSRVLFGYISRVLPRLEDLMILDFKPLRPDIALELQSGFCLLARLSQLAYLRIGEMDRKMVFKAADLRWIVRSGHINGGKIERNHVYRTWDDLLAEEARTTAAETKPVRRNDMTNDVELWKSLENLGLLLDVKKMVEEMEAKSGAYKGGMRTLRDLAIYRSMLSRPTHPEKEYLRLANDNFELKQESWRDQVAGLSSITVPPI